MELKKRSGTCTEEIFWECVGEIGWRNKPDAHDVKRACLMAWTPEFGSSFSRMFGVRKSQVYKRFIQYENEGLSEIERGEYYLGDDGFDDFCSHIVGLGRETFIREMENPRKMFERACDGDYFESFSYCIPHDVNRGTTWEWWVEMHRYPTTKEEFESDHRYPTDKRESFEGFMVRIRRQHKDWQMGDWAYLDPDHYACRSRFYGDCCGAFVNALSNQESLTRYEQLALEFATMLMCYFGALDLGKTEDALEASEEALRAWWSLFHIDEDLGALREAHASLLPTRGNHTCGGENLINDHRLYMGGLEGFECRHHLKLIREASV
jgi:hypothetical protein